MYDKILILVLKLFLISSSISDKMSCIAPGCKTGYGTKGFYPPGVGAHHIPKKPDIRKKWLDAIPRANWKPTKHSRICSLVRFLSDFSHGLTVKNLFKLADWQVGHVLK